MDIQVGGSTFGLYDYANKQYKWRTGSGNVFLVETSGNVGIGTTDPQGFKLAVKGKIGAEEIEVKTDYWPDFVFYKDYKLKNLEEVEDFIEKNNHLPDIPSGKEMLENGVQLGDMNAKLLQKIEELTLYMIEQNKKTNKLAKEVQELKIENKLLKEKIGTSIRFISL